jgi:two-component sensor histidine kinase
MFTLMDKNFLFSETLGKLIYDNSSELIFILRPENGNNFSFLDCNDSYLSFINTFEKGATKSKLNGKNLYDIIRKIHKYDFAAFDLINKYCKLAITSMEKVVYKEEIKTANERIYFETTIIPVVNEPTQSIILLCYSKNITAEKELEKKIKFLTEEMEILSKEIHHRVNNNLQIVLSLINLQLQNGKEAFSNNLFREVHNRIKAMSIAYNNLLRFPSLSQIDFNEYLNNITLNLVLSYKLKEIDCNITAKGIYFNLDTTISCGLMINELMTYYLSGIDGKNKGDGLVNIYIKKSLTNTVSIIFEDGFSDFSYINDSDNNTLSFSLINMMVTQLNGTFKVDPENKSKVIILFTQS